MRTTYFNKPTKHYMQRKQALKVMNTLIKYLGYSVLAVLCYLALVVIAI